jgi:hypothetical protein
MRSVETVPEIGGGEVKKNGAGDEFNYGIL